MIFSSVAISQRSLDLDVEVADFFGVFLDELPARLDLVAHQRLEQLVDVAGAVRIGVVELNLKEGAGGRVHRRLPQLLRVHLGKPLVALHLEVHPALAELLGHLIPLVVRVGVVPLFARGDEIQRRVREIDLAVADHLRHVPIEERQQQRADVRPVHVGIGHEDHFVVAALVEREFLGNTGADRGDDRADLLVAEHLVFARLLDVQDLALDRQDGLKVTVAAGLRAAAGRLALDDEQLALRRVLLRAVRELARQRADVERVLAAHQFAGLAGRLAGARGLNRLGDDLLPVARVRLEVLAEGFADDRLDDALDLGVAELGLGLPFELGLRQLDRQRRGEALPDVVALDGKLAVLDESLPARVVVDRARQRRAEADEVRATLGRVDRVDVGVDVLEISGVVLDRRLDFDALARAADGNGLAEPVLVLVLRRHELGDAALVQELLAVARPLVEQREHESRVQVGQLVEPLGQDLRLVFGLVEDVRVGLERDGRPGLARLPRHAERRHALPALEPLGVALPVALDLDLEPFGERVDDRHPDTVEAARDLVAAAAELAAGVQHRHDDLDGRLADLGDVVDGNAAAVVGYGDAGVFMDDDVDAFGVSGEGFVDAVVDDLEHEVVQTPAAGAADVHAGTAADPFQPFEHLNLLCVVCAAVRALIHA